MKDLLLKLKACKEAIEWAGDKTAEEIIDTCHRGDWLLWLAYKLEVDDRPLTLAKGHCANTVRHLMKDERSIKAVDAAIAYGNGEISKEELKDAASAACSASAAADAASYAADAYAAAYTAACSAAAAYTAACSASAAAAYTAACSASAAAAEKPLNQLKTADICRKYLGKLILELC
jgi:hypothetical protein